MTKQLSFYRYMLLVLFICMAHAYAYSETIIPIDSDKSDSCMTIDVLQSDQNTYRVRIKIHKLKDLTIGYQNETYHKLSIGKESYLHNVGEPSLPTVVRLLAMPKGSKVKATIKENKWTDVSIGKIYPAQEPYYWKIQDTLSFSDQVYSSSYYQTDLITVGEKNIWKGLENVCLTVCPFKYYPSNNRLSVLSDFTIIVHFHSDKKNDIEKTRPFKMSDSFVFDNSNIVPAANEGLTRTSANSPNYLIIVGDIPEIINSEAMKTFRRWKALKGYSTEVVSTSTIGTDSSSIKSYIAQNYPGLEYVLLVGDHEKIPLPKISPKQYYNLNPYVESDYWYGCMDGINDVQADIPVGRFITNTLADFDHLVTKTIKYESLNHNWAKKTLLVANMQNAPGFYQGALESIYNEYGSLFDFYKVYASAPENGGNNGTATDVYNYVNNGINILTYNGHGNQRGWWFDCDTCETRPDILIYQADTARMNSDTYPVMVSTACLSGRFTLSKSIIWQFTRSDHCASAYIGGSIYVYTYAANKYLQSFYQGLLTEDDYHLGSLNVSSHIKTEAVYPYTGVDNAFGFICAGDPSLELWTDEQNTFQQVSLTPMLGNVKVSVGNSADFTINVASKDGDFIGQYQASNGECTIPWPNPDCDIAINKHNYVPYVLHVDNSNFIQNTTICKDSYYFGNPLSIGYDVVLAPFGDVRIVPDAKVKVSLGNDGVYIKNNFECEAGAELVIE